MLGLGTDIVQIARIQQTFAKQGERFVQRLLTDAEQAVFQQRRQSISFLANRFAAKEAIAKALGTGIAQGVSFNQIEILPNELGAPTVQLYGAAQQVLSQAGGTAIKVSISDERDYCVAFAVML